MARSHAMQSKYSHVDHRIHPLDYFDSMQSMQTYMHYITWVRDVHISNSNKVLNKFQTSSTNLMNLHRNIQNSPQIAHLMKFPNWYNKLIYLIIHQVSPVFIVSVHINGKQITSCLNKMQPFDCTIQKEKAGIACMPCIELYIALHRAAHNWNIF